MPCHWPVAGILLAVVHLAEVLQAGAEDWSDAIVLMYGLAAVAAAALGVAVRHLSRWELGRRAATKP